MLLYPVNWFFLLLHGDVTYRVVENLAFFHIFLAGAAMYLCLRHMEGPSTADVGRAARRTCLHVLRRVLDPPRQPQPDRSRSLASLVFLFFHRAVSRGRVGQAVLAGIFLALAALAGHVQMLLYIIVLLGCYAIYWIATIPGVCGVPGHQPRDRVHWAPSPCSSSPCSLRAHSPRRCCCLRRR